MAARVALRRQHRRTSRSRDAPRSKAIAFHEAGHAVARLGPVVSAPNAREAGADRPVDDVLTLDEWDAPYGQQRT